jgi:hypothetical protein
MHTALAILAHALRMLIFETATTLRIILPALILVLGSALVVAIVAPDTLLMLQEPPEEIGVPASSDMMLLLVFGVIGLLGYALMAVLWHRHVLLNGTGVGTRLFPSGQVFIGYVGRTILVGFVQMLASIPIMIGMGLMEFALAPALGAFALFVIGVLGGVAFVWVALRFSLVLPAAALGNTLTLRDSWATTAPLASTLWAVGILLTALNIGIFAIAGLFIPDQGSLALIAHTLVYLVEGIVFISVLTTLYGNLVEGRSLG